MHHWFTLLGSSVTLASATTEHLAEDVHAGATATSFLDTVFTVFIVELALLFVTENFVGALNLLELVLITTAIWMVSPGQLEVSFLDCAIVSVLIDTQDFVEFSVVDLLGWSTTWHATHLFKVSEWETTSSSKEHSV